MEEKVQEEEEAEGNDRRRGNDEKKNRKPGEEKSKIPCVLKFHLLLQQCVFCIRSRSSQKRHSTVLTDQVTKCNIVSIS